MYYKIKMKNDRFIIVEIVDEKPKLKSGNFLYATEDELRMIDPKKISYARKFQQVK